MTRADDCDRPPVPIPQRTVGGRLRAVFLAAMFFFLLGCDLRMKPAVPEMARPEAERISPDDLDDASLEKALAASLRYYQSLPPSAEYPLGKRRVSIRELQDSLLTFREIILSRKTWQDRDREIRRVFDFVPSEGADGKGAVLFTGYFESVLEGWPERTERFRYPLYRTPPDAVTVNLGKFGDRRRGERIVGRLERKELVPYYSRDDIDQGGALAGRGLELLWLDDPVDRFLLHVQGSGIVRMGTDRDVRVHGVASNGRPYRSIARYLADQGQISKGDTAYRNFKTYLRGLAPDALLRVLGYNERYIFFRLVEEGPIGSLGFPVTAGRSIATDPEVFPEGALAFVRLRKPTLDENGDVREWNPVTRYVLSQDKGSAIKGPGRVDLFCGTGAAAEMIAGSLKERGELFFLLKKPNR
jgi:membrane-bound lytic murein transglycosylase A